MLRTPAVHTSSLNFGASSHIQIEWFPGPAAPVATPCRVRRKLFTKGDSQKTLKTGDSTETLGSVEKAALRRVRTVDMLATPLSYAPTVKSPKSPTLSTAPTVGFTNNDSSQDETPTTNSASEKDVEKTSAAEAKVKSKSKGKTAKEKVACRTTPKKPSAQFMRMKKHLDEAKLKRLEREAEESKTSKTSKTSKISKTRPKAAAAKAKGKISLNKKALSLQPTKDKGSPSKKGRHEKGNENRKDEAADPGETSHKSEATAKKSHAMYMKYWRSIKSTEVAIYIFFVIQLTTTSL